MMEVCGFSFDVMLESKVLLPPRGYLTLLKIYTEKRTLKFRTCGLLRTLNPRVRLCVNGGLSI